MSNQAHFWGATALPLVGISRAFAHLLKETSPVDASACAQYRSEHRKKGVKSVKTDKAGRSMHTVTRKTSVACRWTMCYQQRAAVQLHRVPHCQEAAHCGCTPLNRKSSSPTCGHLPWLNHFYYQALRRHRGCIRTVCLIKHSEFATDEPQLAFASFLLQFVCQGFIAARRLGRSCERPVAKDSSVWILAALVRLKRFLEDGILIRAVSRPAHPACKATRHGAAAESVLHWPAATARSADHIP